MRFIFTGTGTSQGIPVIGCTCQTCTSQDTRDQRSRTAAVIQSEDTSLAIDVGPDFRHQMLAVNIRSLSAILLTHEHNDHIAGLDDVRPFNFLQKEPMQVYGLARVLNDVKRRFAYIFANESYPGAPTVVLNELNAYQSIILAGIEVQTFLVHHGNLDVLAFRIGDVSYVTDANHIPPKSLEVIKGSKVLVLNALHHKTHHSHFNLAQALELTDSLDVNSVYFTHMSHHMGLHRQIQDTLPEGRFLAYDGLEIHL
ncbi:MAG: MBL fold metallo-hydrolase [Saprospiraceae bacterium]|nr:MBL fold metallo-hydrolase [Saprospiraceae bacterium]